MRESLSSPPNPTDLRLMRRALLAAGSAAERGEVPVGAVVARGEEVLAVATNEREATNDPTAHAARLDRLVYATPDPKAGYAGTLHDVPADARLNHTIAVEKGLLEAEAAQLLRNFFKNRRARPQ